MTSLNNPKAISAAGIKIYDEKYRAEYERLHDGRFVAINVLDGSAVLGASSSEALANGKRTFPNGLFHLIRVGHRTAFEVAGAQRNAGTDWVAGR